MFNEKGDQKFYPGLSPGPRMMSPEPVSAYGRSLVKSSRFKRDYMMVDNSPDYFEEDYLIPPRNNGEIAQVPPPKDNLFHWNEDPTLGAKTWRIPVPNVPLSDFGAACAKTPRSSDFERIIPWDHKGRDFVYGAIHDHIFRGRFNRRRLKRKIDHCKGLGGWDPISGYMGCFMCCICLGFALAAFFVLLWMFKPYNYFGWYLDQWWFWLLAPLFIIMILATYCCIVSAAVNQMTRNRYRYLKHACDDVNDRHLAGSGVRVYPGTKGAWLAVAMDPNRTDIVGDVIPDRRFYRGTEDVVKNIQEVTIRREEADARAQIPIEGRPKNDVVIVDDALKYASDVSNSRSMRGASPPPVAGAILDDTDNVEFMQPPEVRGSGAHITHSATSAKKMSFYEKLKASKMANGNGGRQGTPVRSQAQSINNISRYNSSGYKGSPRSPTGAGGINVGAPRSPTQNNAGGSPKSAKKLEFYERLKAAKQMKQSSMSPNQQ